MDLCLLLSLFFPSFLSCSFLSLVDFLCPHSLSLMNFCTLKIKEKQTNNKTGRLPDNSNNICSLTQRHGELFLFIELNAYLVNMWCAMNLYVARSPLTRKEIHFKYGTFPQNRATTGLDNSFHDSISMLGLMWCSEFLLSSKTKRCEQLYVNANKRRKSIISFPGN